MFATAFKHQMWLATSSPNRSSSYHFLNLNPATSLTTFPFSILTLFSPPLNILGIDTSYQPALFYVQDPAYLKILYIHGLYSYPFSYTFFTFYDFLDTNFFFDTPFEVPFGYQSLLNSMIPQWIIIVSWYSSLSIFSFLQTAVMIQVVEIAAIQSLDWGKLFTLRNMRHNRQPKDDMATTGVPTKCTISRCTKCVCLPNNTFPPPNGNRLSTFHHLSLQFTNLRFDIDRSTWRLLSLP